MTTIQQNQVLLPSPTQTGGLKTHLHLPLKTTIKLAWMKHNQSVDISFSSPMVLLSGKATKKNATVKVHVKLKSKLLTNALNQFNGFTMLYLI
jgi:hypothetical protein